MAMRQRSGGISGTRPRQSYRPIYEDFQPQFESKEDQEAHIVDVHLPGFVKEQVRITFVHSPPVIRVYGQRPLGNDKWSRFNKTFPVQENSNVRKIHGKFVKGILTITIPKQVAGQIAEVRPEARPVQETAPTSADAEPKAQKAEEGLVPSKASLTSTEGPHKSSTSEPTAQKGQQGISETATPAAASRDEMRRDKEAKPQKLEEGLVPSKASFETSAGPQKSSPSEPKAQTGQQGISERATLADSGSQDEKHKDKEAAAAAAESKTRKRNDEALPKLISAVQDEKRLVPLISPERRGIEDDKNGDHSTKGISETKAQRDNDEALPKLISAVEKQRDEKRQIPLTSPERGGIREPNKSQKGQDAVPPTRTSEKRAEPTVEDRIETTRKPEEPMKAEKVVKTTLQKERETGEIRKEATVTEMAVQKISEKAKKKSKVSLGSVVEHDKPKKDSISANMMAAAKQHMKNPRQRINDEEKQMLINVGAAVLVLLALGASASYNFWSSGKAKN